MLIKVRNINVNYKQYGKGDDVVLLHGWGQNIQMMEPLGDHLKDKHRVTIIDLPGFGLSEEPDYAYTVYDYVQLLEELFSKLEIVNPSLIGHSFGGRLSIIYASRNKTNKMVLFGSPCVRHEYKSFKQSALKTLKKVKILNPLANIMKGYMGSPDYKNASPIMREILVKVVNEDLSECAKKIECPTLLIWGKNDEAVPLNEAHELESLIKDAGLVVLEGTHYCYLENLNHVNCILDNFL